jgi:uncharacterized protein
MKYAKQLWHYLILVPLSWLFYCCFQPTKFKREFEITGFLYRIIPMIRLALPIFIVSFSFVLVSQLILCQRFEGIDFGCHPNLFSFFSTESSPSALQNTWSTFLAMAWASALGVGLGVIWGIVGSIKWGITGGMALAIVEGIAGSTHIDIIRGITLAIVLAMVVGTIIGIDWGIAGGIAAGIVGGTSWGIMRSIVLASGTSVQINILGSIEVAIIFMCSYILGYYRLLLYPASGLSGLRAYLSSRKNPLQVFTYLHRSSLYWDERIFLPILGLKHTLLIAVEQNTEQVLEELSFILNERPLQRAAAQGAFLEIAIRDLEKRDTIRAITRASQRLAEILPQEVELIDPRWVMPFARLHDASRNAARYYSPLGRQARQDALEEMIKSLDDIHPYTAFRNTTQAKRLDKIVKKWQTIARDERQQIEQNLDKFGQIDNPYIPGQVLKLRDSLFVGRRDLVQQLGEALSKGKYRPTFLLTGERRMGKSSTLEQLPNLLGAHYLSILFDLQKRGISSSADTFLGTIAEEVEKALSFRGIRVKKLKYEHLQEAGKKNEAAIYRLFDQWLEGLEHTLEQENRTLFLLFDEFEKLEEAAQEKYLNLNLLLDWFRSVIQNYPRLALLFSGVHSFSEMGPNWAGYFVNVQTLKVSFLQPAEARHLITHPTPTFPGEQVFDGKVIEEIIRVTGCHPFLVQAICSALIECLNAENRDKAEFHDVRKAVNQVLENWWDTYFRDLWERTSEEQRICLTAMMRVGKSGLAQIVQESVLDPKNVQSALQVLCKRDLALHENGSYQIAAPIFCEWVERNS